MEYGIQKKVRIGLKQNRVINETQRNGSIQLKGLENSKFKGFEIYRSKNRESRESGNASK